MEDEMTEPRMSGTISRAVSEQAARAEPWQLKMFRKTLKKQQKLRSLSHMLGNLNGKDCLLITHGDNNGALNWHFRRLGGRWVWADFEDESVRQISQVTGDQVVQLKSTESELPLPKASFDLVLTIDVHEHLDEPDAFNRKLSAVAKPGGKVIVTTPNGDEDMLAVRIKKLVGMTPEVYGHRVIGFTRRELENQLRQADLSPDESDYYSKFFTEMLELAINFAYVKVLGGRGSAKPKDGQIAPQSEEQLQSVQKSYRLYSLVYPFVWLISRLDLLIPSRVGYAVIVAALKPKA